MSLYLIAHKVRGQPAFDIAEPFEIDVRGGGIETWWIIPTSGHRAYPYWQIKLRDLWMFYGPGYEDYMPVLDDVKDMPEGLQDHYKVVNQVREAPKFLDADQLLKELDL